MLTARAQLRNLVTRACVRGYTQKIQPRKIISVGDVEEESRTFSADEVLKFAELSGDFNPVHLDQEYAKTTRFGRCIVHGVLLNG
jgi:acyl dehydratase